MGTRANIEITYKDKVITSKYLSMDGHLQNWAPNLINALNTISTKELIKCSQLLTFMSEDCYCNNGNDWSCEVKIIDDKYEIMIKSFDRIVFTGSLEKFASEYNFL